MASSEDFDGRTEEEVKEAYFLRLNLLMVKKATYALKCKFDDIIPPNHLQCKFNDPKTVSKINYDVRNGYINARQRAALFPTSGPPKYEHFDISLLFYLLRNICNPDKKSQWWKYEDNSKIPKHITDVVADIVRIRNLRNKLNHSAVASLEKEEFETEWDLAEEVMVRLTEQCGIRNIKAEIDEVKTAKLDVISEGLKSLRDNTAMFLEDHQDEELYVKTGAYKKALQCLKDHNIVVITGHPGEGKTTMAARLALQTGKKINCLLLKNPSDWRRVDLSLKLVKTIIIDDIFGPGSLDEKLLGDWKDYLGEIGIAVKKKRIQVIITSRNYIFLESREELGSIPIFGGENDDDKRQVLLTSSDLDDEEKIGIFKCQAKRNKKQVPNGLIKMCVLASKGPTDQSPDVLFGFPECVSMFVRHNSIYDKGALFFKEPAALFQTYLQEEQQDKFLALVIVWSKEGRNLSEKEIQRSKTVSDHVKRVAEIFDREIECDFLETIQRSLKSHIGGFLVFNERNGEYSFSHNVIGDMVGLVIANRKCEPAIEICPRDFLMEFVGIEGHEEHKVILKERQYPCLAEKMAKMIMRQNCNEISKDSELDDFVRLKRSGQRENAIRVHSQIDFGLIKHRAFQDKIFLADFIKYLNESDLLNKMFQAPVMSLKGYFFDYGIKMRQLDMRLMDYAWFIGAGTFAREILDGSIIKEENKNSTVALLLAVHSRDVSSVKYLLENGTKVTGDAIYIAVHHRTDILKLLLSHPNTDINDRGNAVNGNYPLIVAARKGFLEATACLLKHKADPGVRNSSNLTALHKAIIYKKKEIVDLLLAYNAPLDVRGGKFKRTPLHIAVDLGSKSFVKCLLSKNPSLLVKDHRGHYPIHIAAIRGHTKIVEMLRPLDDRQERFRISSYGKMSKIRGFSLFHIAVWKKNKELLTLLIETGADPNIADWFGQTALFSAIMGKEKDMASMLINYERMNKRKGQKQGFTPLHASIFKGLSETAKELVPYSDVNTQDKFGRTALHVACEMVNTEVIDYLLDNRADQRMITKRGDTIFHILRRKAKTLEGEQANNAKLSERYFALRDPEFVKHFPSLINKAVISIMVRPSNDQRHYSSLQQYLRHNRPLDMPNLIAHLENVRVSDSDDDNDVLSPVDLTYDLDYDDVVYDFEDIYDGNDYDNAYDDYDEYDPYDW
ncbi:hypothetical protein ACF0H5_016640 [Mactra antiquata]